MKLSDCLFLTICNFTPCIFVVASLGKAGERGGAGGGGKIPGARTGLGGPKFR